MVLGDLRLRDSALFAIPKIAKANDRECEGEGRVWNVRLPRHRRLPFRDVWNERHVCACVSQTTPPTTALRRHGVHSARSPYRLRSLRPPPHCPQRRQCCREPRQRTPTFLSAVKTAFMKYIEFPELARLSQALTHEGPECSVHTRIEAYSCKNIKRDKKLFKALEHAYSEDKAHSPPPPSFVQLDKEAETTPFGPMDKHASRKTLYLLIATLNIAFPDHEFSDVRPAHFCKEESGASVLNALSNTLVSPQRPGLRAPRTYSSYPPTLSDIYSSSVPTSSSPMTYISPLAPPPIITGTHPTLYRILDDIIGLSDCEVFSYVPDIASDPHATDYSDFEEDTGSTGEDDSSAESEEETFAFDDYDVDEMRKNRRSIAIIAPGRGRTSSTDTEEEDSSLRVRYRSRGALLWSSHWFFLNRKLKRVLFISICARTKGGHLWTSDADGVYGSPGKVTNERFLGWEGSAGAGARALGLKPSSI